MKVILLQDVKGIGKKFDTQEVADGYARNFLLPRRFAEIATASALAKLEKEKVIFEEKRQAHIAALNEEAKKIAALEFVFRVKVGKKKEVFGSVTNREIEKALKEGGTKDAKTELLHPLKELGGHKVTVDLGEGVKAEIKVTLKKEEEEFLSPMPSQYFDDLNKFL